MKPTIDGRWQDGHSSAALPATLERLPRGFKVRIAGTATDTAFAADAVRISPRVGNIPRRLEFPGGGCFETEANDAVDAWLAGSNDWGGGVHALESRWHWVLAAVVATAGLLWTFVAIGLPRLAERVAARIPPALETRLGEETLATLDGWVMQPSRLPPGQQERGRRLLAALAGGSGSRLEFRAMAGGIANAFALPSGVIIVTDGLMELADRDEELLAVLAHELAHVHGRHSVRGWLQNSASAVLIATVLGDVQSLTAHVAVLPTVLLQSHYSRAFEQEADDSAAAELTRIGVSPCHLGDLLRKLEAADGGAEDDEAPGFLASHPDTGDRIDRLGGPCAAAAHSI